MIDYFFSGNRYIRVSRGDTGPGSVNSGYPAPISNWGWGSFGANGIDAALYSGRSAHLALIISELPPPRPEHGDGGLLRRCVMCRQRKLPQPQLAVVVPQSVPL
jgi:hypothetical protein